jgi:RNA polymerase primary sigma factor
MAFEDNDNGFQLYLREIGEYPLITVEDEVKLARRIKRGDKEARAIMIRSNLRLVVKIARELQRLWTPSAGFDFRGQHRPYEGGRERFDPKKGGKLSTYAAWWIQAIDQTGFGQPEQNDPACPCTLWIKSPNSAASPRR